MIILLSSLISYIDNIATAKAAAFVTIIAANNRTVRFNNANHLTSADRNNIAAKTANYTASVTNTAKATATADSVSTTVPTTFAAAIPSPDPAIITNYVTTYATNANTTYHQFAAHLIEFQR